MTKISSALVGALVVFLAACSGEAPDASVAAAPVSLPGGTSLEVNLTEPVDGALVATPPGKVQVSGTVSLGEADALPDTLLVYTVDASTGSGAAAACGEETTVLDCERAAVSALNARAVALGMVGDVGAALFGAGGAPLDVGPAEDAQLVTGPSTDADDDGTPDVLQALGTVAPGGVATEFTPVDVGGAPVEVGSGLEAALAVAAASARPTKIVVLLAASPSAAGPGPGDLTVPADVMIRAFALPGTTCDDGLAAFAALGAAGSGCTDVADAADLPGALEAILDAELLSLELSVDGVAQPIEAVTLPAPAPFGAAFSETITGLAPGAHELCVSAAGRDAGGDGGAQACATVLAASLSLTPLAATYELGTPGQTATVTAEIAAGAEGGVAGVPVVFEVTSGPNAGKGETVTTDADGHAAFTYEAVQHLEGLGTDEIQACFTDDEGTEACATATVTWQDTTPPVVACIPGPNPGGVVVTSDGGLSPSGFMRLTAVDAVDPAPIVFLEDTGSGTVFGPFDSGVAVKYTQAPGTRPRMKEMGGAGGTRVLHVMGSGDPAVRGRDAEGNESAPLVCAVPPFGK